MNIKNEANHMRTKNFYMANLGSEMLRAFSCFEKGDIAMSEVSISRCMKIVDTLLADSNNLSGNKEIVILKKVLENIPRGNFKKYSISKKDLEIYFNPFAVREMSISANI